VNQQQRAEKLLTGSHTRMVETVAGLIYWAHREGWPSASLTTPSDGRTSITERTPYAATGIICHEEAWPVIALGLPGMYRLKVCYSRADFVRDLGPLDREQHPLWQYLGREPRDVPQGARYPLQKPATVVGHRYHAPPDLQHSFYTTQRNAWQQMACRIARVDVALSSQGG
jgi:hypothetical protein